MTTPHPDCSCQQQRSLTEHDLKTMYAAGKYEQINRAFEAGKFDFNQKDN